VKHLKTFEMIKYKTEKVISVQDWDRLVEETYGKPYSFQQQDGCQPRGRVRITIPDEEAYDDEQNDIIPFEINGNEMCVKFQVWLDTTIEDVNAKFEEAGEPQRYPGQNSLFWKRNFYPELQTVANDLHKKGLIEAGKYTIDIDW
jgi:hypothetical protein